MPRRSCEQPAVPDQITVSRLISSDWAAQDLAYGPCSTISRTERVFWIAWRKRNQEAGGIRCAVSGGVLPRSIATMPNPPPCSSRSVTFRACSGLPPQRIHSSRLSATPAADADAGSNTSSMSTRAQTSSRAVACARAESNSVVRPDEGGPSDFRHCATGEIQPGNAGWERLPNGLFTEMQDVGEAAVEDRLESCGRHLSFAFYSPVLELCSKMKKESNGLRN